MPEATVADFGLENATPDDYHRRRSALVEEMRLQYNGKYENLPAEKLAELAFITAALRRKNSGPPKKTKAATRASAGPKAGVSDFVV